LEERLNIRVSKDFKNQVKKQAADKGFSTVTQYIKFLVANDKEKKNGRN
jgi:predicted DNA binding CopG/RHH family protein